MTIFCIFSYKGSFPLEATFQDIIEVTKHFHPDMRIAEGHFSDIYRAHMGDQMIAVKLFKQVIIDSNTLTSWETCLLAVQPIPAFMHSLSIFLQVKMQSWKNLWDVFRKEMETHLLYVTTLKIPSFIYLIESCLFL